MAPNGNIYFTRDSSALDFYSDDFSLEKVYGNGPSMALLVHEMTHVYQHQNGVDVIAQARALLDKYGWNNYDLSYAYHRPAANGSFDYYNIEQQAEIVEHRYRLEQGQTFTTRTGVQLTPSADLKRYRALTPF